MVITSEAGSGKSLSYLLPIINSLYKYKDLKPENSHFVMEEANENVLF
jgi:superfamily II DNA/RNA helicase